MSERRVAGIDVGSGTTTCVVLDEDLNVVGSAVRRTTPDFDAVAREVLEDAGGGQPVAYVATTGLGRYAVVNRQIQITDMTCSARAAHRYAPEARYVLDVGSQSTRAIKKDERGKVREFKCNEKCAAGSGGFLERAAKYLEITVEELGELSIESQHPQAISSVCAVLAESEIINHVSEGRSVADIVRGIHDSLAERAMMLLKRLGMDGPVVLMGGVARQPGMVAACRDAFGVPVIVPPDPHLGAALGAAVLGWQRLRKLEASVSQEAMTVPTT